MKIIITILFLLTQGLLLAQLNIDWLKQFGGNQFDLLEDMIVTSSGDLLLLGMSDSPEIPNHSGSSSDIWIMKLSADGNLIWQRSYGGIGRDESTSVIELDDGFVITGLKEDIGLNDIVVFKIDKEGDLLWEQILREPGQELDAYIVPSTDGGFILSFTSWSSDLWSNYGSGDIVLLKLDAQGNMQWSQNFGGSNFDQVVGLTQNESGDFVIAGHTRSSNFDVNILRSPQDYWILCVDKDNRRVKWERTYGGGDGTNLLEHLTVMPDGYLLSGSHGGFDLWFIKTDLEGNFVWQNSLETNGIERIHDVISVSGGFLVCGNSDSTEGDIIGDSNADAFILMLDNDGELVFSESIAGSRVDAATAIATSSDYIYLGGDSNSFDGDFSANLGLVDLWVARLNTNPSASNSPDPASSLLLYPNPTSEILNINIVQDHIGSSYSITNIKGHEVRHGTIGQTSSMLNIKGWLPGIYTFNLHKNGSTDSVIFYVTK